jgi:hypothetical protein
MTAAGVLSKAPSPALLVGANRFYTAAGIAIFTHPGKATGSVTFFVRQRKPGPFQIVPVQCGGFRWLIACQTRVATEARGPGFDNAPGPLVTIARPGKTRTETMPRD